MKYLFLTLLACFFARTMLVRINILLWICCAFSVTMKANDLKLVDGRVLKNYRIINHSPKDAMIIHDDGAESVLLKDFPEDLRKQYAYSDEEGEAYGIRAGKSQR